MLARRYLNPRRSLISSFSLISLIGVMLGVMVLVVVMAVYSGMEREVKRRLLGFTPHLLLRYEAADAGGVGVADWRNVAAAAAKAPGVENATPFIADNVVIDVGSWQRPVMFRGIDTVDKAEIAGIDAMLDKTNFPESSADMGLDDRVVVSANVATQFKLHVGDTIRLYSTRNFEKVMEAYKATEGPAMRVAYKDQWSAVKTNLAGGWKPAGEKFEIPVRVLRGCYDSLDAIRAEKIREPERQLIDGLLVAMEASEKDEAARLYRFSAETKRDIEQYISELENTDTDKMDGEILKGLKQIILPKEVVVVGVYQSSQMAVTPDLFVPLKLAQGLAGLDDAVEGIGLRLTDPYAAPHVQEDVAKTLPPGWTITPWMEQFKAFSTLINQQRAMMYMVLSVIMVVSAFSMMAVMFTVTIQKRREIGVMKALGAAPGQIVRVFLYQGMLLGAAGGVLGVGLGWVFIHFRGAVQVVLRNMGFDPFSASFTGFDTLPAHIDPMEPVIFATMAFVLCSLATLVPAFFASRSDAAKSLRNL
jgi:lipoprotein-releasing system permease protein